MRNLTNQLTAFVRRHWLTTLFIALYVLVTVATLRHSAAGFASLEGGNVAWGYLSALAVDAGMALSATGLRKRFDWWLVVGLLVSAAASTFTQLLYAVAHAALMPVAPGAAWMGDAAVWISNWRVAVLPALLPLLSIVYSFASKSVEGDDAQETDYETLRRDNADFVRVKNDQAEVIEHLKIDIARLLKISPLLDALPQQIRAQLFARYEGNGIKGSEVAQILDISAASAQRGVTAARKEREAVSE